MAGAGYIRSSARGWGAAARWTLAGEALAAAVWLYAYSFPAPSLVAQLIAGAATAGTGVAALGWAVTADGRGGRAAPGPEVAVGGGSGVRAPTVLVAVLVVTFALCAIRAPMWGRFAEAVPQMLRLAHRAQPSTLSGALAPAWAGTYHFSDVHRSPAGYVEFDTNISGLLQSASFVYSPGGSPRSLDTKAGFTGDSDGRYRHLVGPWWTSTSDVPGA